jgi:hypothetical protein
MGMKGSKAWFRGLIGAVLAMAAVPSASFGQATCNGLTTIDYISAVNYAVPGDIVRVKLSLGTGSINLGTQLSIQRIRFDLDCNSNFPLTFPCTDEGAFIEYEGDGTITTTCGVVWTTGHAVGSAPNEVVFTPNVPLVIPPNQATPPGFCQLEFDVKVLAAPSIDATPNAIEEIGGYTLIDGMCDNGVLVSGGAQSASIPLCPMCNDGQECTTDACNQITGMCVFTPVPDSTPCADNDGNACTFAGCEAGSCVQTHNQTICTPDANPCTDDLACNPTTGLCEHPPVPDSTPCPDGDGNACTFAGCEAGSCVQAHNQTVCTPDSNECTNDPPCNPANGLCEHPPVGDSTPCTDTDGNLCTFAGCEAGSCVQTHNQTVCTPDGNDCTEDPACNPATGTCEHPPAPDSTPCPDLDENACTFAGCEAGQCIQTHIDACPPPIDHFQCYEVKPSKFSTAPVTVQDQFGTLTGDIRFPHRLCNPTDKNNEGIIDPTDHLVGYSTRYSRFIKQRNQMLVDQFGTLFLDVTRPDLLMLPSSKDGVPQLPPLDHFQCYKVKRSKGTPKFVKRTVTITNQFEPPITILVTKPFRLCAPANKNGEDPTAPLHPDHLTCYKTRGPRFNGSSHTISNQFEVDDVLQVIHRRELCVPSLKNPGSSTTTSTIATTTSSTTTTDTTLPSTTTSTTTSTTMGGSPSAAFVSTATD